MNTCRRLQNFRAPLGGSAPNPPGFTAFFPPEWLWDFQARATSDVALQPFRPLAPVARVASQHCPIPSDPGVSSIGTVGAADHQFAANRNLSNSNLSQSWVHFTSVRATSRLITPGHSSLPSY